MAILNATPDSFSGDGVFSGESTNYSKAIDHALRLAADGADILDIGGESTRPGAEKISAEEELRRVVPLIEALLPHLKIPISVDTTKAEVARLAVKAGASIVNDVSGGTFDEAMLNTVAATSCGYVLMHLRGTPQTMGWSERVQVESGSTAIDAFESELERELHAYFTERLAAADNAGIARNRLCLDAGFGFGKSAEENLELVRRGKAFLPFGCATLSATSRKSTVGKILDNAPVDERVFGTAATVALAIASGADIVRVHDVKAMTDVARVSDAIVRRPTNAA
jgi:dihydropteroate synthase